MVSLWGWNSPRPSPWLPSLGPVLSGVTWSRCILRWRSRMAWAFAASYPASLLRSCQEKWTRCCHFHHLTWSWISTSWNQWGTLLPHTHESCCKAAICAHQGHHNCSSHGYFPNCLSQRWRPCCLTRTCSEEFDTCPRRSYRFLFSSGSARIHSLSYG